MKDTPPFPPAWLQRIRNWLRSDMLVLRWVFLTLYVAIIASFLAWFWTGDRLFSLALGTLTIGCQALFIFGGGTMNLCRPIRKRRLWMPALIAALLFGILAGSLFLAIVELLDMQAWLDAGPFEVLFFGIVIANWLFWFLVFFLATRRWQRMTVLGRLTGALIAGSLAELLVAVPSHLIVSRRPGCLVGLHTMLGIVAGLYVMLFAFGPGIALLLLRPRYRRERIEDLQGHRKRPYQFTLRTVFLVMLVVSVVCSWVGVESQQARKRHPAAAENYRLQAEIERLGGAVGFYYEEHPDSLGSLLGDPGVFRIDEVDGQGTFDDDALVCLHELTDLRGLILSGTQVSDAGLGHLNGLARLEWLHLDNTQITDAGLIHLKGLTMLHDLNLSGTQVTDAGLIHLEGLARLEALNLIDTQVTDGGARRLQEALPGCVIEH